MRTIFIGLTVLILGLMASFAFGQTPPVISWGVPLQSYVIERSYDGTNFRKIAEVTPDVLTYTDSTAFTEAPTNILITNICYRIIPKLTDGTSFFHNPTCIPFDLPNLVIVKDNGQSGTTATGPWTVITSATDVGANSLISTGGASSVFRWTPGIPRVGIFKVYAWWNASATNVSNAPYRIRQSNGNVSTVVKDQKVNGGRWNLLGTFTLGVGAWVELSGVNGQANADAVRFEEQ